MGLFIIVRFKNLYRAIMESSRRISVVISYQEAPEARKEILTQFVTSAVRYSVPYQYCIVFPLII